MNMYTTPRKVKQESRLRRSLSLTNTNRSNNEDSAELDGDVSGFGGSGGGTGSSINYCYRGGEDGAFGRKTGDHRGDADQVNGYGAGSSFSPPSSSSQSGGVAGGSTGRLEIGGRNSYSCYTLVEQLREDQPPPYRAPPALGQNPGFHESFSDLPNSVPEQCTYDTHSSKFPFTLDSRTAKDFQEHLISSPPGLIRRNSLDLEKFLQVFNEEQSLGMASMQNGRVMMSHGDGLDNPGMDLISHSHSHSIGNPNVIYGSSGVPPGGGGGVNGKIGSMYFPDSSSSQSLSLSSSNADSMDTVIYKGQTQASPSIRDWQRSMDSNMEYVQRVENNGNMYIDARGYHMQQQQSSSSTSAHYQPLGFNGGGGGGSNGGVNGHGNNFTIEYHRNTSSGSGAQHQNLSVQSIASSGGKSGSKSSNNGGILHNNNNKSNIHPDNHNHHGRSGSNVGSGGALNGRSNGVSNGGIVGMSNGISKNYGGSNPQLASKSPVLTQKQLSQVVNHEGGNQSGGVVEGKSGKDNSSKLFHTKTYNHIKDMISSRFGGAGNGAGNGSNSGGNPPKMVNNSSAGDVKHNGLNNSSGFPDSSGAGPYGGQNAVNYGLQMGNGGNEHGQGQQGYGSYYTASPPTQSPNTNYPVMNGGNLIQHRHSHSAMNGNHVPPPSSYRSPAMNDRKNVNTSFRKAIQQSTQKSNLADESVPQMMMRPIQENHNGREGYGRSMQFHNSSEQIHQQGIGVNGGGNSNGGAHSERAQRALDKLCEAGGLVGGGGGGAAGSGNNHSGGFNRAGSGPIIHSHHPGQGGGGGGGSYANNRLQMPQFSASGGGNVMGESRNGSVPSGPSSGNGGNVENLHSRHKFNVKPGLGSPNSGLSLHENSHSVAFSKAAMSAGITNEAFQGNDEYNDPPPPLPTSQQPSLASAKQDINTIGLPGVLSERRENGDGSSGSLETTNKLANEPGLNLNGSSDQLKQISAELQNLALSVSGEHQSSSSECEKGSQRVGSGQSHTTTDSGHGTVMLAKSPLHSSDPSEPMDGIINQRQKFNENIADSISSGNDSEWVDIVEPEIRQILEMERNGNGGGKLNGTIPNSSLANGHVNGGQNGNHDDRNVIQAHPSYASPRSQSSKNQGLGALSDLASSPTALSKKSPKISPKAQKKFDLNAYSKKPSDQIPGTSQQAAAALALAGAKLKSPRLPPGLHRSNSNSGSGQHRLNAWSSRQRLSNEKGKSSRKEPGQHKPGKLTRSAMSQILYSLQDDNGDITSTTTGLDLESMLDGATECTSDDDDLSTTIDTTDAHAIRRQLDSLETMYMEVLKVLGGKKFSGNRYGSSDLRNAKRRPYGSMSSLPSSVSSRPFREKKKVDDKKKVKDLKSINRRFQRLESHVVTLARSVAHLSSEMRTQHLMVQEMESIRNEMSQLRSQVVKSTVQNINSGNFARAASGRNGAMPHVSSTDWSSFRNALPSLTNPSRVRKLTKFFGDEPPLIRIFLKKLGYEKYATAFEQERIGIMELPYLTEERLNKMGIPMGPRLRILQEAHSCLKPHHHDGGHQSHHQTHNNGNLSVYVV